MYFDDALNNNGAGAGILFITLTKDKLLYVLRIHFLVSNNAAEYEACLHRLCIAVELGVKCLMVYEDYALVINQLNKDWSCSSEKMDAYWPKSGSLKENSMASSTTMWYVTKISSPNIYPSWALLMPLSHQGFSSKISWCHPLRKIRKFHPPSSWYYRYLCRPPIGGNNSSTTSPVPKYPPTRLKPNT